MTDGDASRFAGETELGGEPQDEATPARPTNRDRSGTRRALLKGAIGAVSTTAIAGRGAGQGAAEWRLEAVKNGRLPPDLEPKVNEIVRPLHSMPTILTPDEILVVEVNPAMVSSPTDIEASLRPSFGRVRTPVSLGGPEARSEGVKSGLWPDTEVQRLAFDLPADNALDGLYDLKLRWSNQGIESTDAQRRAVNIVEAHTDTPQVVVIADPSVGDPRPILEGGEAALNGNIGKAREKIEGTLGSTGGRSTTNIVAWEALEKAIAEVSLIDPDFVLVAGDLTFGVYPRAAPYEYEDAYQVFDTMEVPTFYTPGNHDLYESIGEETLERRQTVWNKLGVPPETEVHDGDTYVIDGTSMWRAYFGPMYYSVDIGPEFHLVSMNTFDWEHSDPLQSDGTTSAGGQVRNEQLEWLRRDLEAYRAERAEGQLVTFAHHDPSWIEDRHPWPGENRLTIRDLLAGNDVGVHFSGHTHEDRVARYHRGNVVQTNGRPHVGQPVAELSYMLRDDTIDEGWNQGQLGRILHQSQWGPLFISTTTVSSALEGYDWGLGSYWGWRLADLTPDPRGGYDPEQFGYPASREFLDQTAMRPENWNAAHSEYGLFSYPTYHLESRTIEGNDGVSSNAVVELESDLATDLEVTVRLAVSDDGGSLAADGGEIVRVHRDGRTVDVWVRTTVPAESTHLVAAYSSGEASAPLDV